MGGFYNEKTECGPGWCRVHGKSALNRVFRHAQVFLAVPVLKTICDIVPEIAADAKERFGFEKCCTDWRDLRQQLRSKAAQPQNPQPQVPQSAPVAKFCGKCGSPLNEAGKCPNCDNNQPQA